MKTNMIHCGNCQDVLFNHIPDNSIDLIYVDPPFFSNRQYEVIWGDGYELRAFEDRWKGGIENYIAWMEPKLRECYRALKTTGSMYLHCDWHANHRLRYIMDKIFGEKNFRNEIIWCYKRWTAVSNRFQRLHDTILFYTKSRDNIWNQPLVPYDDEEAHYTKRDEKGEFRWQYLDGKKYKLYKKKGVKMGDWWEINYLNPMAKERLGYPTQKPEDLLERIIKASSNPTDIVLDPMCGCGTAIAVAHKLGRRWIGIDVSPSACKLMAKRMKRLMSGKIRKGLPSVEIIGLPKTLKEIQAMEPFEFQNWVCQKLVARVSKRKSGDMGIDGRLFDGTPIQVKQSDNVGRNVIDNFETAIRREKKKKGIIIAFSFGKGAYEEVARVKNEEGLEIELKTVAEILKEY